MAKPSYPSKKEITQNGQQGGYPSAPWPVDPGMDNLYLWINGMEGMEEVVQACMDELIRKKHELEHTLSRIKVKTVKEKPYCYLPDGSSGSWKYIGKGPKESNPFAKNLMKEISEIEKKQKTKKKELNKFVTKKVNPHLIILKEFLPIIRKQAWRSSDTIKLTKIFSYPSRQGSVLGKMDNKKHHAEFIGNTMITGVNKRRWSCSNCRVRFNRSRKVKQGDKTICPGCKKELVVGKIALYNM